MKRKIIFYLQLVFAFPLMLMLGALKVKSSDASTTKWSENAGRAATEMAVNAEAAAEDWARNTAAATDNFAQAISSAGIKNRFRAGVVKAGAAKFARKIRELAATRFPGGVSAGVPDYKSGVEPFLATLASLSLTPRKPKGDPANYRRVEEVGKALNAKRLAQLGGGGI